MSNEKRVVLIIISSVLLSVAIFVPSFPAEERMAMTALGIASALTALASWDKP